MKVKALFLAVLALFVGRVVFADQCAVISDDHGSLVYNLHGYAGAIRGKTDRTDRLLNRCFESARKHQRTQSPTLCFVAQSDESDLVVTSLTRVDDLCPGM